MTDNTNNKFQVLGSDATLQKLSFTADYMPAIAKMNTLVITKDDLLGPNAEDVTTFDDNFLEQSNIAAEALVAKVTNLIKEGTLPERDIKGDDLESICAAVARDTILERPSAISIDLNGDGTEDLGFVAMHNMDKPLNITHFSDRLFASKSSNIESTFIAAIHEVAHLNQEHGQKINPIADEVDADKVAFKTYEQAIKDGHPLRPEGLKEYKIQRLVGSFRAPGNDMDFIYRKAELKNNFNQTVEARGFELDRTAHTTHLEIGPPEDEAEKLQGMVYNRSFINTILAADENIMKDNDVLAPPLWP